MVEETKKVVLVPGYTGSGPKHWQSLWQEKHPEYYRVEQRDWNHPDLREWVDTLDQNVSSITGPVVLVGHSLGCITMAHWVSRYGRPVYGALLVAPADVERPDALPALRGFSPIPLKPFHFPCIVVASSNDAYIQPERAAFFSRQWGARFINIGNCGHVDTAAGFGPWRQGEVLLQQLLR